MANTWNVQFKYFPDDPEHCIWHSLAVCDSDAVENGAKLL